MRLLTITTDPNSGGSAISLLNLLIGLRKAGIEIMVIVPRKGFLSERLDLNGIKFTTLPNLRYSIWPHKKSFKDLMLFIPRLISWRLNSYLSKIKLFRIISDYAPDIVHSNVSLFASGYSVAKQLAIPHIWHIREYGNLDFGLTFFPTNKTKVKLLNDSYCIAITSGLKKYFKLKDNCRVIYNGIKLKDDTIYNPDKKNYYLFVGHVNPNKGVTDLINAFIKYRLEGGKLYLVIVGFYEKSYKDKLIRLLNMHELTTFVHFKGQIDNVNLLMQEAKALIIPSKHEGFGRITAEAMFNGCLTIGRNTGGTKEQFNLGHDITGDDVGLAFLNTIELKNIMIRVENMPKHTYDRIILRAQKFASEYFSIEK